MGKKYHKGILCQMGLHKWEECEAKYVQGGQAGRLVGKICGKCGFKSSDGYFIADLKPLKSAKMKDMDYFLGNFNKDMEEFGKDMENMRQDLRDAFGGGFDYLNKFCACVPGTWNKQAGNCKACKKEIYL